MSGNVVQLGQDVSPEVRARIVKAANEIYERSGHQAIPTVHQVRQVARADMNSVSIVMREWRMALTVRAAPPQVQVPDAVAAVNQQALAALWTTAQQLANQSLQDAQARWEDEKAHFEAIRQQVATDYAELEAELAQARADAEAAVKAHTEALERVATELDEVRAELARALARAERAEAQFDETAQHMQDLRAELERTRADAAAERGRFAGELASVRDDLTNTRAELDQRRIEVATLKGKADADAQHHAEQRKQAAAEAQRLAERMTEAQTERDEARKTARQAREAAAKLQGQLETLQTTNAALISRIGGGTAQSS